MNWDRLYEFLEGLEKTAVPQAEYCFPLSSGMEGR